MFHHVKRAHPAELPPRSYCMRRTRVSVSSLLTPENTTLSDVLRESEATMWSTMLIARVFDPVGMLDVRVSSPTLVQTRSPTGQEYPSWLFTHTDLVRWHPF